MSSNHFSRVKNRKFKFIGCEVLYREACFLAAVCPNNVDVEFLKKGLHDLERTDMLAKVQQAIDSIDSAAGYEAILLGYARCNDGVVGLRARQIPLVVPRAHDCITLFFGSRREYKTYFEAYPGTYFLTTGWAERDNYSDGSYAQPAYGQTGVMGKLGLAEPYEKMVEKYGKDNADFIMQTIGDWTKNYSRCCYIKMGVCMEEPFVESARRRADESHWAFEVRQGDISLLGKMFAGKWDDDFLIVPPGKKIVARNDEMIIDTAD